VILSPYGGAGRTQIPSPIRHYSCAPSIYRPAPY
jgi:hypothetical protein